MINSVELVSVFGDLPRLFVPCILLGLLVSCGPDLPEPPVDDRDPKVLVEGVDYFLPNINLNNWKVTLPIGNPTEVKPPEILSYGTNATLKPFMYNDSTDGSLVFYTYPGASTTNSSYSRTELREQMTPGSNDDNWTFVEGGRMKGRLKMSTMTQTSTGAYHRAIIMQIHGRLTDAQKNAIGASDNNAPPVLKIYWNAGNVRVHRKVLKDPTQTGNDILHTDAWEDEAQNLGAPVNFDEFELEIIASDGRMEVVLNNSDRLIFDDIHMQKWNIFENYFKAGNYLNTLDAGSFSRVKYYELEVSH